MPDHGPISEPLAKRKEAFAGFFSGRLRLVLAGSALVLAVFLVYIPALSAGFIWDDESWTTRLLPCFHGLWGLYVIWFHPTTLQQYYPLSGTTFWLDYQSWQFWPLPYHAENILLHALAAVLFWRLLVRLRLPGAWLAAALFAVHPVMVESVAWVTERKNVLSQVLFLAALLAYDRFSPWVDPDSGKAPAPPAPAGWRSARAWSRMLPRLLFLGAVLAKTTTFSLPVVVLLLAWWQRGKLRWREDVLPMLPYFAVSFGMCVMTVWLEKTHVGAEGTEFDLGFLSRCLVAGHAFWFYLGKLFWPVNLSFIYPRWNPDPAVWWQWIYPLAALGAVAGVWLARRRLGRGVVAAVFYYLLTLLPVMGFVSAFGMRYSFVWDHWVYLSSLGFFAALAALVVWLAGRWRVPALAYGFAAVVLPALGLLSWQRTHVYRDVTTIYKDTLARNPDCWLAYNNLGVVYENDGQYQEAIDCFQNTLRLKPDYAEALCNMGAIDFFQGRVNEAIDYYQRALQYHPGNYFALCELAFTLPAIGQIGEAIQDNYRALQVVPDDPRELNNLAWILATCPDGHYRNGTEAIRLARRACDLDQRQTPKYLGTLAAAYAEAKRFDEAVVAAQTAEQMAMNTGQPALAEKNSELLELYQAGKPYRDPGLAVTNLPAAR